jgi:ribosomal protein S18 acetylase RimI-like enzyme
MASIQAHFNPNDENPPQLPSLRVTNFVACRKKKIVAFVQLVRRGKNAPSYSGFWLFSLHVWPLYRGMGIGEVLSRRIMERARAENARELSLLVYEDNQAALCMYAKLGFTRIIIPELEKMLEDEKTSSGRRRIVMRRKIY